MDNIRTLQGDVIARDLRIAIIASRFNDAIVENLVRGAVDALLRGFPLPPEKYDQWREMELVFNPDGMRMR